VRLASGLDARCDKKQCGLVGLCFGGRMAFDLRLSRARMGVVAMRQDSNYQQLDTTKLGRKILKNSKNK
jgi:dienelactone hydrolase